MKLNRSLLPSLLATLAATSPVSRAAERMWDGGDATTNFSAAANWDGNTAPATATDNLNFPAGVAAGKRTVTNNYPDLTFFRTLNYQDSGYALNGNNRMRLTDGVTGSFASGSVNIDAELVLAKNQTWFVDGGGDINFLSGTQIATNNFALTLQPRHANSVLSFAGTILGDGIIRVQDEGLVRFPSAGGFYGDMFIEAGGTLEISHEDALDQVDAFTIVDGTLSLNKAAAMSVALNVKTMSAVSKVSTIESRGLGHLLSGSLDVGGDWDTTIDVQGTSLTLGGAITSTGNGGGINKTGPGRLLITGSSANTADLQSFRALEGETWLARTNGPAISHAFYLYVGRGQNIPDNAVIRLGASNQMPSHNNFTVLRDGFLDLNGYSQEISLLNFQGAGHIATGAGTLRTDYIQAYDSLDAGHTALITGNVVLTDTEAMWTVDGDDQSMNLKIDGPLSGPPSAYLRKIGKGGLEITGPVSVARFKVIGGTTKLSNTSPDTNVEIETGNSWDATVNATGTLGDIHIIEGKLTVGGFATHGDLVCNDLTQDAAGTMELVVTNFLPNMHDVIHVHGAVELHGSLISGFIAPLPPAGQEITVIDNDGTDLVIGAFSNVPEGALVLNQFILSYKGGDGNDVTLTRVVPFTGTTRTWDGGGADNNWSTDNNWNPNGAPEEGDNLLFPVTAARKSSVNDYPANTTFNSISVQGTPYIFNGNSITLNEKLEYTLTTASNACNLPLKLAKHAKISIAGTSNLLVSGPLNTNNKTLTFENTGDGSAGEMTVTSIVSGTGDVAKTGPGKVAFSGNANTYTGYTTVEAGVLTLTPGSSLGTIGSTSGSTVNAGATLELRNNDADVSTFDSIDLNGTVRDTGGAFGARLGSVSVTTSATLEANGDLVSVGGALSGAGNVRKTGAGRLTLDGTQGNTWTGTLTIAGGEVLSAKASGSGLPATTLVGEGSDTTVCRLTLGASNQIPDAAVVRLHGKLNVFNAAAFQDRFATLSLTGGTVGGTAVSLLTLSKVEALASPNIALVTAPLSAVGTNLLNVSVSGGAANPDLELSGPAYGSVFDKNGSGSVHFTSAIPAAGLDTVKIKNGSALFFADCRYTNIEIGGGTLGGTGTVGTVTATAYATVAPGSSPTPAPGKLSAMASTWSSITDLRLELNGLAAGTEYDQFIALAPLTLGGSKLNLSSTFTPSPGAQFIIIRNDSGQPVSGTFTNTPEGGYTSAPGGLVFQVTYHGGDGDDVVLTAVPSTKPEIVSHSMQPGTGDENLNTWDTRITAKGIPGVSYRLEYSANLTSWGSGSSVPADLQTGLVEFQMYHAKEAPRYFFRVRLP